MKLSPWLGAPASQQALPAAPADPEPMLAFAALLAHAATSPPGSSALEPSASEPSTPELATPELPTPELSTPGTNAPGMGIPLDPTADLDTERADLDGLAFVAPAPDEAPEGAAFTWEPPPSRLLAAANLEPELPSHTISRPSDPGSLRLEAPTPSEPRTTESAQPESPVDDALVPTALAKPQRPRAAHPRGPAGATVLAMAPSAPAPDVPDEPDEPRHHVETPLAERSLDSEWTVSQRAHTGVSPATSAPTVSEGHPSGMVDGFTPEPEVEVELPEPVPAPWAPQAEAEDAPEALRPWETARLHHDRLQLTIDDELSVEVGGDGQEVHVHLDGTEAALDPLRDVGPELRDALASQGFSLGDLEYSERDSSGAEDPAANEGEPDSPTPDEVRPDGHLVYAIA